MMDVILRGCIVHTRISENDLNRDYIFKADGGFRYGLDHQFNDNNLAHKMTVFFNTLNANPVNRASDDAQAQGHDVYSAQETPIKIKSRVSFTLCSELIPRLTCLLIVDFN